MTLIDRSGARFLVLLMGVNPTPPHNYCGGNVRKPRCRQGGTHAQAQTLGRVRHRASARYGSGGPHGGRKGRMRGRTGLLLDHFLPTDLASKVLFF